MSVVRNLMSVPVTVRANHVFRQVLEPITMMPVEEKGRRFYRATGAAKGAEIESPHL